MLWTRRSRRAEDVHGDEADQETLYFYIVLCLEQLPTPRERAFGSTKGSVVDSIFWYSRTSCLHYHKARN